MEKKGNPDYRMVSIYFYFYENIYESRAKRAIKQP